MEISRPERLVYLLDVDAKRRLRCEFLLTRLMKWESFQPAPIRRILDLMQARFKDHLRESDRRILLRLTYWESSREAVARTTGPEAFELLKEIVGTGRAFLRGGNQLRLNWSDPRSATPKWEAGSDGLWTPQLLSDPADSAVVASEPPCYLDRVNNTAGTIDCSPFSPALAAGWLNSAAMKEPEARAFCLRLMNRFPGEQVPTPGDSGEDEPEKIPPQPCLRVFRKEIGQSLTKNRAYPLRELALLEVRFAYGPRKIDWHADAQTLAFEEKGRVRRVARDPEAEQHALDRLRALGFDRAAASDADGLFDFNRAHFQLAADAPAPWPHLLEKEFPRLRRELDWMIAIDEHFNLVAPAASDWFAEITRTKDDWFSFETGVRYRGKRIPILQIVRSLFRDHPTSSREELLEFCRKSSFTLPLEDGDFLLLPGERIVQVLTLLFESRTNDGGDHARIGAWRAAELAADGSVEMETDELVDRLLRLRRENPNGVAFTPVENLPDLPVVPRAYQREGLAWLDFLRKYDLSGILADDMGLGKTMQVLVHILHEKQQGRLDGPCLIVVPTSVIDSWEAENARFTPALTLRRHHGPDRRMPTNGFAGHDLVLTSYTLARTEVERFRETDWALIVLDEAQRIKNAHSETARSLRSIPSRRRLCLTGTPLENHLGELWSLFAFLMPGYLGDPRTFNEAFRKPIEDGDEQTARETAAFLAQRLQLFILRRKKDQVAKELPPRTELTRLIRLTPKQAEIYETTRLRLHRHVADELEKRGIAGARTEILDALLKLRQLCCDPRLHPDGAETLGLRDSAKLVYLMEMLENLIGEGRRILIFSPFVTMLELIAAELEKKAWPFLLLTGDTAERGKLVERFQNGETPIFLISLKAGGAGLTLTAADTVIQYDPWWNPAVEQQAADRVHRIGQDKPVFHYRLIAKGTVEEKILQLQERKQAVIDSILDGLPAGRSVLDKETIDALFAD